MKELGSLLEGEVRPCLQSLLAEKIVYVMLAQPQPLSVIETWLLLRGTPILPYQVITGTCFNTCYERDTLV